MANDQRREIYALRDELMSTDDVSEMYRTIRADVVNAMIDGFIPPESLDELWDVPGLTRELADAFGLSLDVQGWLDTEDELHEEPLRARILEAFAAAHLEKEKVVGSETMRAIEKAVMLQVLDVIWKEHLAAMDYLRQGIHLRGYAQKNPKQEYKRESFEMFRALLERFKTEVTRLLARGRDPGDGVPPPIAPPAAARAGGVLARRGERARVRGGDGRGDRREGGAPGARGRGRLQRRPSPSCGRAARSAATSRAPAARARSTSTATAACTRRRTRYACCQIWPADLVHPGGARGYPALRTSSLEGDQAEACKEATGRLGGNKLLGRGFPSQAARASGGSEKPARFRLGD